MFTVVVITQMVTTRAVIPGIFLHIRSHGCTLDTETNVDIKLQLNQQIP